MTANATADQPSRPAAPPGILHGPHRPELWRAEILAEIFEATAARIPHTVAMQFGERELRYGDLNAWADRIAHRLIEAGVKPGTIAGLWMPRGIEALVCQLAIAKTGAAWLPMDPGTPPERVAVCVEDAQAVALVTSEIGEQALRSWAAGHGATPGEVPAEATSAGAAGTSIPGLPPLLLEHELSAPLPEGTVLKRREGALPSHTAYVIYTSGSTGKPKGIAISQGSICHFLRSENSRLGVREGDRVYQGFSISFDMSFEEIWISWLVGATLWIGPPEAAGDPDVLPRLLADNGVTVLHAVPTLLALFAQDVPSLRLINLGGEMCPQALVEKWARADRPVFNTYGPTEATVSASLAELRPGEPVTIGEPLPNYDLMVIRVIDDDAWIEGTPAPLELLPPGETGELCISGPGVAEGYLGRPDLTSRKFLPNPWATGAQDARLYRTGDLARIEAGQMQCLGRADDQVKIRGFRVELGEIEAVLARQEGVGTTAVVLRQDDGVDQLVAFLVPSAPDVARDIAANAALRQTLAGLLPPYMVPARFEWLDAMPRIPSGKIDRKVLKAIPLARLETPEGDIAETPAEEVLFAALKKLFPGQPIRRHQDFFTDLGGHSLLAARTISALRADPRFAQATVRDLYRVRKIGALAEALQESVDRLAARGASVAAAREKLRDLPPGATLVEGARPFVIHNAWRRWRCGIAQAAVGPILVLIRMAQWLAPFFTYHFHTGEDGAGIPTAVFWSVVVFLVATLLEFVLAWIGKRLVGGGIRPGSYPLWGWTYFRWWLADRMVESAPTYMLSGSSLYVAWLRALGAKVGRDVVVGSITFRVPELITIGDGVSIGNGVNLENACVRGGMLHIGRIDIGDEASIGSYCVLEASTKMEPGAQLQGQSSLTTGQTIPRDRIWTGSPASEIGVRDPDALPPRPAVSNGRLAFEAVCFVVGALVVAIAFFMPVFPTFMLIDILDVEPLSVRPLLEAGTINEVQAFVLRLLKFFAFALPASFVLIGATALIAAGIRWLFLPRMTAGTWAVHSNKYLAKWLVNQIQESSLAVLHGIYATVFSANWYRLLGAEVGRDTELSTALGVVPDMLTLGDETFIADAVMLGDEQIEGGWMTVRPTRVEHRSFVGNGAYVPDGTVIPPGVLIGVMSTVPREQQMRPGDTWLGSPAMHLPAREVVQGHAEDLTYRPTTARRWQRGTVEAFRIAAPHALVIALGYAIVLDAMPWAEQDRWGMVALDLALAGVLFGLATFLWIVLLKWPLIGRYTARSVPMWTPFVWLSEAVTNMYEGITVPYLLRYLRGTPLLPLALNLLGCKIHPTAWLDTTDVTEYDCVHVGAHSELNALAGPQTHLFEDRVMKIDHVRIGDRVTLGARCTVLYGASVGDDVEIGPLSLVMKGESLPAGTAWHGVPAAPAA